MRDPVLNEALKRLAAEAATRLSTLVASGDPIPFDVAEQAGPDSPFHSYRPLTAEYVRRREAEIASLPSFEPARSAVLAADVAASYLENAGEPVPAQPRERAARMLVSFLAGLWDECTEFSLNLERLEGALARLDAEVRDMSEADVLLVPLVGLRMGTPRLKLPHGVEIVRADAVEAPAEAMRSEGMGRRPWDPQFLAVAEGEESEESAEAALRQLRGLVIVMRLFKRGGIGLGPHAFAPMGEGRWRRLATGASAVRPGGYALSEEEADRLAELASDLELRPDPEGALAWALNRFELGCGRASPLEGLSDHLLALRALLEGEGPVGASLPVRAAALIGRGSEDRHTARKRMEAAMELERSLMRGGPRVGTVEIAEWVEDSVRGILREAALGRLGADLGSTADASLIAGGLEAGDVAVAVTTPSTEPDPGRDEDPAHQAEHTDDIDHAGHDGHAGHIDRVDNDHTVQTDHVHRVDHAPEAPPEEEYMEEETRIMEPIPAEDEIRITATNWLEEVEAEVDASTLNFPAIEGDLQRRERIDTPTVRHLFPVPEDAEWEVRELEYDHYERRRAG